MNQYKRIVSYLYQYINGIKGQNIGYVRIEQKGNICRITVQMRASVVEKMPEVLLYRQESTGIEYIKAGTMGVKSGNMICKIVTPVESVCDSGMSLDQIDGAIVYIDSHKYYGTSWINDEIVIGDMHEHHETYEHHEIHEQIEMHEQVEIHEQLAAAEKSSNKEVCKDKDESQIETEKLHQGGLKEDCETADVNVQDICLECPFKNRDMDYGQRMLAAFPVMYPFKSGIISRSVRIEPKDIGCLPIQMWSLTNNKFLLHGYYCYHHLLFIVQDNGRYAIGVPGIYSDKEAMAAEKYKFKGFQTIGESNMKYGAFGYWLYSL